MPNNLKIKKNNIIKLLLPKKFVPLKLNRGQHVYFLAGPIRGADDWQKEAIKLLFKKDKDCYIVCPCRYDETHELYKYALHLKPENSLGQDFPNQTLWERYYLELASYYGAIIFWLPLESKINPRRLEDGPYARDTMGEIGRWSIRHAYRIGLKQGQKYHSRVNLVIGANADFPGLRVIKKNLDADCGHDFKIFSSLDKTISEAVKIAKK